jgi:hypothetical protein
MNLKPVDAENLNSSTQAEAPKGCSRGGRFKVEAFVEDAGGLGLG